MGIAEEENRLFAELRTVDPDIIDDGIVCEEEYLSAKYKIMYVLKEVNGRVVISFAHPEARVRDCFLHYALVDAVREISSTGN